MISKFDMTQRNGVKESRRSSSPQCGESLERFWTRTLTLGVSYTQGQKTASSFQQSKQAYAKKGKNKQIKHDAKVKARIYT
jgi:hypothetical protein